MTTAAGQWPLGLDLAPREAGITGPSDARIYDYLKGGAVNTAADRAVARQLLVAVPHADRSAHANMSFVARAVRWLANIGIRQILDIGAGLPTVGAVHETLAKAAGDYRVVYVDNDIAAVMHTRDVVKDIAYAAGVWGDLTRPSEVVATVRRTGLLDFHQPVGILTASVWHFVPDEDDPAGLVAAYRDAVAPGSYMVFSHLTRADYPDQMSRAMQIYQTARHPMFIRDKAEIEHIASRFGPFEPPGLVYLPEWKPEDPDDNGARETSLAYGALARRD
jgi:SAM-dependent methyltransferase